MEPSIRRGVTHDRAGRQHIHLDHVIVFAQREVALGDGYGSQNTLRQYFGLGDRTTVDELIVKWPRSGLTQRFRNVAADRIIEITEGGDALVEKRYLASGSGS